MNEVDTVVKLHFLKDNAEANEQSSLYYFDTSNSIAFEQFNRVCRTCLTEGEHKSIFDISFEQKAVSDILTNYASVQVQLHDPLPQNMCSNCLSELHQMYYFIRKCQHSDMALRYVVELNDKDKCKNEKNTEEKIEPQEDKIEYIEECDTTNLNENDGTLEDGSDFKVKLKTRRKASTRKSRKRRTVQIRHNFRIQGPPFKCKDCNETFDLLENLRTHRKEARHPEARNHACTICSKMFTSSKLRQHMRAHTKEKPYKCKVCLQGFSMSGNLKRHMMTHTGERPHVCEICRKGFIQATTLQNHKKTHVKYERIGDDANGPHFVCNYCGRGFKRLARYNAHLKKHFSDNANNTNNVEEKKVNQDDEPREHVCMICKRAYKTKHLLKAHQLTHGEKTFLCSECGKGFVTKAALQSHLKVHTGEKPHTCNVCKKSFAHVGSFEAHMLIHTGQKPYNCNICTKAFTQLSHLKYHLRTHSGERPYICTYCGKSFALKGNLTVHVRTHTGETPYICPVCDKGFYDSSSMKKHARGHGVTYNNTSLHPQHQLITEGVINANNGIDVIDNTNLMFT